MKDKYTIKEVLATLGVSKSDVKFYYKATLDKEPVEVSIIQSSNGKTEIIRLTQIEERTSYAGFFVNTGDIWIETDKFFKQIKDSLNRIEYDPFVYRQFSSSFAGTKVSSEIKDSLLDVIQPNSDIKKTMLDSKWDFCKYLVIENTFGIKCAVKPITLDIYPFIRTDYSSRTPSELPILTRFAQLPPGIKLDDAKYIVFVLYSSAQLEKEFKPKLDKTEFYFDKGVSWGIVSIMGTMEDKPDPLVPVTIMRNALGIDEGGNGEVLDKESYMESVDFWSKYILVK